MPGFPSVTPDITESLPLPLGTRTEAVVYQQANAKFDVSVANLPFLLAPSDNTPYVRTTAESRKQQLDTSQEPGEQSLSQWWTRSQDSWHKGAGVRFYEPGTIEATRQRYHESRGIDVWTEGQASLLYKMNIPRSVTGGQTALATGAIVNGTNVAFLTQNGVVYRWDGTTATTYSASGGTPASAVAVAGAKIVVGTTQSILSGDATGTGLTALWTSTVGVLLTPYWVKSRIIATRGPNLYELTLTGGALPTALYTHPDTNWQWTGVAETPTAILASGYSNGYGAIYRFQLITDGATAGSVPTLGSAEKVAEFPPGEQVHSLATYLGTYVIIGTSRGVRVGVLSTDGGIQYGPLTVETTHAVTCIAARDSFAFAGVTQEIGGGSGAVRIDLSQEIEDSLRFAWAWDVQTHDDGTPGSIGFLGNTDRVLLGVSGEGIYLQSNTQYEQTGFLTTGRLRYATTVPKIFSMVQVRAKQADDTAVSLTSVRDDTETFVFRMTGEFNTDQDITLPTIETPLADLEIKLTLEASTDLLSTPVLDGVTIKAIPQPRTQRTIVYPFTCFDREIDRNGVKVGYDGSAWDRLLDLEDLEQARALVLVNDYTTGDSFRAWIQRVEFTRTQPPVKNKDNFGGRVNVTVVKL